MTDTQVVSREQWLGPVAPPAHPHIVLVVPAGYNTLECGTMSGIFDAVVRGSQAHSIEIKIKSSSALTFNFNQAWAEALNERTYDESGLVGDGTGGITHFAMIHTDIIPLVEMHKLSWFNKLWAYMYPGYDDGTPTVGTRAYNVVSAISPIKHPAGLTSTALDTDRWAPRKLTLHELSTLPNIIDNAAMLCGTRFAPEFPLCGTAAPLLINTGRWLADIRGLWAEHIVFDVGNRITKHTTGQHAGKFVAEFESEDWKFARDLFRMGVPYCAVRDVPLHHMGPQAWDNYHVWGHLQTDRVENVVNNTAYMAQAMGDAKSVRDGLTEMDAIDIALL